MYFIPRNFSDNGRVMGMFEARYVIQAALLGVPLTFLVSILPLLPLNFKAILWGVLVGFPAMVILSGMADRILHIFRFRREARIYYRVDK